MYLTPSIRQQGARRAVHFGGPPPQFGRRRRGNYRLGGFGLGMLGAADPGAIYQQVMGPSGVQANADLANDIKAVINAVLTNPGYLLWSGAAGSSGCTAQPNVAPVVTGAVGSMAIKLAPATGPAAPFVLLGGAIISLFSAIFAHHAQAVAKERQTQCALLPAASNYLQIIKNAVAAGASSPQDGMAALDSLQRDFESQIQPILKMGGGQCNAACWNILELRATVLSLKSLYTDLAQQQLDQAAAAAQQQQSAPATSTATDSVSTAVQSVENTLAPVLGPVQDVVNSTAITTGIPAWAIWLAGGFLLYKAVG